MKEESEVYVGNGRTITVTHDEKVVHYLDMDKLKKHFEEKPETPITVGATGDWYFTAQTIKNKVEFEEIEKDGGHILRASSWSTFRDEDSNDFTIDIPMNIHGLAMMKGYFMGLDRIEFWLPGIYRKMIRNMNYEQITAFVEDVKIIMDKHNPNVPKDE